MDMLPCLTYDNVSLVPKYFAESSRSKLCTRVKIKTKEFDLPIIPANMKCVIDESIAYELQQNNYFYVMHRFGINNFEFVSNANTNNWNFISISVGVKEEDVECLNKIHDSGLRVDCITVDIAHGHCASMKQMLSFIKRLFKDVIIVAGNVGSLLGAEDLCSWGADVIKVGIGPGKSCITKLKTGFYTPMFSTIRNIRNNLTNKSAIIIADGGIQHNGDIAKAVVAGADLVMAGSLFAQCIDSPGQIINGKKVFYGSASAENKGTKKNVEGKKLLLDSNNMYYLDKMKEIKEDLQSSISYAGGTRLSDLRNVNYIVV